MKHIQILSTFIILFLLAYLAHSLVQILGINFIQNHNSVEIIQTFEPYIDLSIHMMRIASCLLFIYDLVQILNTNSFNIHTPKAFKIGSVFLMIAAIFKLVLICLIPSNDIMGLSQSLLLLIVGLGIFVIGIILKNGYKLKSENDLTI